MNKVLKLLQNKSNFIIKMCPLKLLRLKMWIEKNIEIT